MNALTPTPEDLIELLDELRQMGYKIGADQHITVNDLLVALAAQGRLPCQRQELRNWLASILCTSPKEQADFYQHFDQWLDDKPRIIATLIQDEKLKETDQRPYRQKRLQIIVRSLRPWHWVTVGLTILVAFTFLVILTISHSTLYTFRGKVINGKSDEPIQDAEVSFLDQLTSTTTSGEFSFTYPEATESQTELVANHQNYRLLRHLVELNRQIPDRLIIRLEPLPVLDGKVLDGVGKPVGDASVSLLQKTALTDELGNFSFTYQTNDNQARIVVIHPVNTWVIERTVELNRQDTTPLIIKFELEPPPQVLTGSTLDNEDNPVIGAQVSFLRKTVLTGTTGGFSFIYRAEGDGQAKLAVTHPEYENVERLIQLNRPVTKPEIIRMLQSHPNIIYKIKKWVQVYQHYFKWIRSSVLALPFLIFGLWWVRWIYRRRLLLKRHSTTEIPQLDRIMVEGKTRGIFQVAAFHRTAQKLRRHREVESRNLDAEATVEATIKKGGWFTPIYDSRQVLPEYLVLIDCSGFRDHQALFVDEIIDQLTADDVFVTRYYFDSDPRDCWSEDPYLPHLNIEELATRYADHRLVIFSDGSGFMNPLTGEPDPWLEQFKAWSDRAILTPENIDRWEYREWALSELDFIVLPASQTGLSILIETIQTGTVPQLGKNTWSAPYPEMLRERPERWLGQREPETKVVENLCHQLYHFLGEEGYYWLGACAVYPDLSWALTVFLGNKLSYKQGKPLLNEDRLLRLARLPWFRHGSIPDWLRLKLISDLSEKEATVRCVLKDLFSSALKKHRDGLLLEIASKHKTSFQRLKTFWNSFLGRELTVDQPSDYVFLNFMSGHKPSKLVMMAPDILRNLFFHRGRTVMGTRPIAALLIAIAVALVGWTTVRPMPDIPEIEAFNINPITIVKDGVDTIHLTWEAERADKVSIKGGIGASDIGLSGSLDMPAPDVNTTFELVSQNRSGETIAERKVLVGEESESATCKVRNDTRYGLLVSFSGVENISLSVKPNSSESASLQPGEYRVTARVENNPSMVTSYAETFIGGKHQSVRFSDEMFSASLATCEVRNDTRYGLLVSLSGVENISLTVKSNSSESASMQPGEYRVTAEVENNPSMITSYAETFIGGQHKDIRFSNEMFRPVRPVPTSGAKWAVVIGISDYQDYIKLRYAHRDALAIQERLLEAGMDRNNLMLLVNQEATKARIASVFQDTMAKGVGLDDIVFIYFSGLGYRSYDLGEKDEKDAMDEYILPVDAQMDKTDTWIRDDDFSDWIMGIKARLIVIVFDTCYAGWAAKNVKTVGPGSRVPMADGFLNDIVKEGTVVMAACAGDEVATESDEYNHGLFTYHLLDTFKGPRGTRADDEELFEEVRRKVRRDSLNQNPVLIENNPGVSNPIHEFFPSPAIEITLIPPYDRLGGPDSYEDIAGKVVGVDPRMASKELRVVIYLRVDRWYVQPTEAEPLTEIETDGSWSNWTHGGMKYAALLVKDTYQPPSVVGQLPRVGGEVIASTIVDGK